MQVQLINAFMVLNRDIKMKFAIDTSFMVCSLLFSLCLFEASPVLAQGETDKTQREAEKKQDETKKKQSTPFDLENAKRVLTRDIEETLKDTGIPSISIVLIQGDRIVWAEAFGYSNVKLKIPAKSSTIYGTGSCLKPITAMAVMQLVDDGKIGLDDPINKYLGDDAVDDLSEKKKPVTVRHLLSHYSGLTVKFEALPLWKGRRPKSLRQLASELKAEQDPGKTYQYSNSGYAVAGLLVEKVSGMSYEHHLVEKILKPLGVKLDGPIYPTPVMIEEMALPYRIEGRKSVPEARYRFDVYPAGDAYLSAPAMAKILLTQNNNGTHNGVSILSETSVKEMQKPQFGGEDGMDFGIRMFDGEKLLMHGGGVRGFSSKFILGVNSKVGVYVVSNARADLANRILAQRAIDLLLGKKPGKRLLREVTGLGIGPAVDKKSGLIRIVSVYPRSPASRAGLSVGQMIRTANGVSAAGKSLPEFLKMISGSADKPVKLEVLTQKTSNRKPSSYRAASFSSPASHFV